MCSPSTHRTTLPAQTKPVSKETECRGKRGLLYADFCTICGHYMRTFASLPASGTPIFWMWLARDETITRIPVKKKKSMGKLLFTGRRSSACDLRVMNPSLAYLCLGVGGCGCLRACVCACVSVRVYLRARAQHTNAHTHTRARTHTYTHTYTHTLCCVWTYIPTYMPM